MSESNNEGGSSQPTRNANRKNRNPKGNKSNNANNSSNGTGNNNNNRKRIVRNNNKSRSSTPINTDPTQDSKFLQISKLIRTFKPVTVNGISAKKLIDNIKQRETQDPQYFKQYKNHARLSNLQKYLLEFIKNNPDSIIYISFIIKPSDPEFPFDLDRLKINLSIPVKYPQDRPSIVVLNEEIPRGFAINIELGYRRIINLAQNLIEKDEDIELVSGQGLLSTVLTLDKYLELFLKQEKRETFKFVKPVGKKVNKTEVVNPLEVNEKTQEDDVDKLSHSDSINVGKVDAKTIDHRNDIIDQFINKLGQDSVKLFKSTKQESHYKISLPLPHNTNQIPNLWQLNKGLDILIKIPINYPQSNYSITMLNNFNTNLILKYEANKDQKSIFELTKHYKQIERNFNGNVTNFKFEPNGTTNVLLMTMNWLSLYMGRFCLDSNEFGQWKENVHKLQLQLQV
ncbi:hypothetical protein DFJ63DRAFT_315516 [Scheffersomyces coipomensis]|uniref:uncharacterized protein n=1 Tax=Scheffersomyces coipomensis TaxID=1788519 RepID=UPI00315C9D85